MPERDVDAVCCRPLELDERCCPEPCCWPLELDSLDSPERELLAVCVVPVPCASPPDEVLELDELVVLLDELLLDGSAVVVVLDEELVLAV